MTRFAGVLLDQSFSLFLRPQLPSHPDAHFSVPDQAARIKTTSTGISYARSALRTSSLLGTASGGLQHQCSVTQYAVVQRFSIAESSMSNRPARPVKPDSTQ